jgi:hypothetical protein
VSNSTLDTRISRRLVRRFKSARQPRRFASVQDRVTDLFMQCRDNTNGQQKRDARWFSMLLQCFGRNRMRQTVATAKALRILAGSSRVLHLWNVAAPISIVPVWRLSEAKR